jgi:hypothetical protein
MPGISWIASPSLAMTGGVITSGSDAIQLVIQDEAGLPRRFVPRNDGVGFGEKWLALAGSLRVRSR